MTGGRPRVLCVDDEPLVLEGLRDGLRRRFDIVTAQSANDALALIQEHEPFVAVVSDMCMPGMDGVQFLEQVRRQSPDTVRLLLTGNADVDAAIGAVNRGQVFRFLLKPCPSIVLGAALDAAVQQNRLITSERVLLQETLAGAVQALVDVLALTSPKAFGRASRLKSYATEIATELNLDDLWELELAATMSQVGCITLPAETAESYALGRPLGDAEQALIERLPATAARILRHIPRLDGVHAILAGQYRAPGEDVPVGSLILRIVHDYDVLESRGHSVDAALDLLRSSSDEYDPTLLDTFARLRGSAAHNVEIRELALRHVELGMVFAEDVHASDGTFIVSRGHTVTISLMEKILNLPGPLQRAPARVYAPLDDSRGREGVAA